MFSIARKLKSDRNQTLSRYRELAINIISNDNKNNNYDLFLIKTLPHYSIIDQQQKQTIPFEGGKLIGQFEGLFL